MPQGKGTYGSQVGRPPKKNSPMGYSPFRMKAKDYGNSPMKKNYGEFGVGYPEAPKKPTADVKSPAKFFGAIGRMGGAAGGGFLTGIMGRNPKVKAMIEKIRARKAEKAAEAAAPEEDATAEDAAAEDAAAAAEGAEAGAEETAGAVPKHGPESHTRPKLGKLGKFFAKGRVRPGGPGGMIRGLFSDVRLKEKIQKTGVSPSGIPIYEFNYIGSNNRYSGAMAQDLLEINPSAVTMDSSGYYKVNYNDIDVDMHQINN